MISVKISHSLSDKLAELQMECNKLQMERDRLDKELESKKQDIDKHIKADGYEYLKHVLIDYWNNWADYQKVDIQYIFKWASKENPYKERQVEGILENLFRTKKHVNVNIENFTTFIFALVAPFSLKEKENLRRFINERYLIFQNPILLDLLKK